MTDKPLVSIIVPVYGAEKYLYRCLDSILAQTFTSWDCILVDDGSKDRSGIICDEYAQKDSRFRVFHKENGGVSSARQYGMERALESDSIYSIHVDPDDWVEPTMLEELLEVAINDDADVVICDFWINSSEETGDRKYQNPRALSSDSVLRQLISGELHGFTWNKLYRSSCLKKHNVAFPQGINYSEDLWFNCELFLNQDVKVAYLQKPFYHYDYYSNSSGLSRKLRARSVKDYLSFIEFIHDELQEDEFKDELAILRFNAIRLAFRSDCSSSEFYSIFPERSKEFRKILSSSSDMPFGTKYGLLLALKGRLASGHLLLKVYERIYVPIARAFAKWRD